MTSPAPTTRDECDTTYGFRAFCRTHFIARAAVALFVLLLSLPALADEAWRADATVAALVDEALKVHPELRRANALVTAAQERVPQAQAWPDPMLQFGIQNDGFRRWQVGVNEMSWVSIMASQTIPFPGKTSLGGAVAEARTAQAKASVERARRTVIAEVRRSVVDLQLARARLEQLALLEKLVSRAATLAQVKQESGDGMQADVLRARLEVGRIAQRRRQLELEASSAAQALNRARGVALDQPIGPLTALGSVALPASLADDGAAPEVEAALAATTEASRAIELAGTTGLPDVSVSAGVMVRGSLDPMWSLTIGAPVPVIGLSRRAHALDEARASQLASERGVEDVSQRLQLADAQRRAALASLLEQHQQARALVRDAEAATAAVLSAYQSGKVPLTAVLDADAVLLDASDAVLQLTASALRVGIAHDERSLAAPATPSAPTAQAGATTSTGGM